MKKIETRRSIAIVGAGFSGSMAALNLCRLGADASITLFDRSEIPHRGYAFGTPFGCHLLNVPVQNMSAFPDTPRDFLHWLEVHHPEYGPDDFVPRNIYGNYLESRFREVASDKVMIRADNVNCVERSDNQWKLTTDNGEPFFADAVVLALSNDGGTTFDVQDQAFIANPWSERAVQALRSSASARSLVCIGSGLTAVDMFLAARESGFSGKFTFVSRRALLPRPHSHSHNQPPPGIDLPPPGTPLLPLMRALREESSRIESGEWQQVMEAIRPKIGEYWTRMTSIDQSRFLRHLRTYWEVHRHRIAPQLWELLQAAIEDGSLRLIPSPVREIYRGSAGSLEVRTNEGIEVADLVFDCTGSLLDLRHARPGPIARLLEAGEVVTDSHGIGLRTDDKGRLLKHDLSPQPNLMAIGALRRGELWESTAVRELRTQANEIARTLCA